MLSEIDRKRENLLSNTLTIPCTADQLVQVIRQNNPATVLQFYLTWGRPYGEQQLCQTMQQFCSYETMQVGSQQLAVTPTEITSGRSH